MEKELTLTIYSDSGHAWVFVPFATLERYDLFCHQLSRFSYYDKKGVYAEQDCDATKVIDAITKRGTNIAFEENHFEGLSPIRELKRIEG